MLRFFSLFRKAVWSAFRHDAFGVAKGAAYSSILTMFPALMLSASILISFAKTQAFIHEISNAVGRVMPPGTASTAETYFQTTHDRPIRIVVLASIITRGLLPASSSPGWRGFETPTACRRCGALSRSA